MISPEGTLANWCQRIRLATIEGSCGAPRPVDGNAQPAAFNRQIAMYLADGNRIVPFLWPSRQRPPLQKIPERAS